MVAVGLGPSGGSDSGRRSLWGTYCRMGPRELLVKNCMAAQILLIASCVAWSKLLLSVYFLIYKLETKLCLPVMSWVLPLGG